MLTDHFKAFLQGWDQVNIFLLLVTPCSSWPACLGFSECPPFFCEQQPELYCIAVTDDACRASSRPKFFAFSRFASAKASWSE